MLEESLGRQMHKNHHIVSAEKSPQLKGVPTFVYLGLQTDF